MIYICTSCHHHMVGYITYLEESHHGDSIRVYGVDGECGVCGNDEILLVTATSKSLIRRIRNELAYDVTLR